MQYTKQNQNVDFDRVISRIGRNLRNTPPPEQMDVSELAEQFDLLIVEFSVVPPQDIHAADGHRFILSMLERAAAITRGLSSIPGTSRKIEQLGKIRR